MLRRGTFVLAKSTQKRFFRVETVRTQKSNGVRSDKLIFVTPLVCLTNKTKLADLPLFSVLYTALPKKSSYIVQFRKAVQKNRCLSSLIAQIFCLVWR